MAIASGIVLPMLVIGATLGRIVGAYPALSVIQPPLYLSLRYLIFCYLPRLGYN